LPPGLLIGKLPPDIGFRSIGADDADEKTLLALLSDAEQERFRSIRHPKARRHFLFGRSALRLLLAERMALDPVSVPLVVAPDGGVDVFESDLRVSIAHAGEWGVAVAAPRMVGVDLERIRPRSPDVVRFMLDPSERDEYEALPLDPVRRLILYWTLKESVLKALRTGFRRSPKRVRFAVQIEEESGVAFLEDGASLALRFQEYEGYYVAVAFAPANAG